MILPPSLPHLPTHALDMFKTRYTNTRTYQFHFCPSLSPTRSNQLSEGIALTFSLFIQVHTADEEKLFHRGNATAIFPHLLYISSHPSPPHHSPLLSTLTSSPSILTSPSTLPPSLSSPHCPTSQSTLPPSPSSPHHPPFPPHPPLLTVHPHHLSPLHRLSHSSSKDLEQDRAEFEHCFDDWMAISESHTLVMLLSCDPISSSQILLCFWN